MKHLRPRINIKNFPDKIQKLLSSYDSFYVPEYDWNNKTEEFKDIKGGFSRWLQNHENEGLSKNLKKVIRAVRQDLILLKRRRNIEKILYDFEDLIKPALSKEALVPALSKYMEVAFFFRHDIKELERAHREAKNIFDEEGSIDTSKIEMSEIFTGGDISLPGFEKFANENPEYKGVFNDWKKLFDEDIKLSSQETNSFNIHSYEDLKYLYDFLLSL